MNYKKFLFYTSFFIHSCSLIHAGVATLLDGMSDEELQELIKQGEAQLDYYMNHATPEEKAAFDEAMAQTLQSFNEADWNALQNVAEKIEKTVPVQEPVNIPTPAQKTVESQKTTTPTKSVSHSIEDKLKELLLSLIKSIDKMINTIHASKDLERHMGLWVEKSGLQELQKLIHFVNRPHNIKRLATTSQENTDFIALLESFQKTIDSEQKNISIYEDDFGRSVEIKEDTAAMSIESIQQSLIKGINSILPKIKEFLTKYDPEALEFAKSKDAQSAKALDLEKQNIRSAQQQQAQNAYKNNYNSGYSGGYGSGSNSHPSPMPERRHRPGQNTSGGGSYPSYDETTSSKSSGSSFGPGGKTSGGGMPKPGDQKKGLPDQKEQKEKSEPQSAAPKYINALKEHFDIFETDKQLENTIKQAVNEYPVLRDRAEQAAFLEDMREYISRMKKSIKSVTDEVTDLESITNPLSKSVKDFSKDDAKTILENKYFKKLIDKTDAFIKMIEDFKNKINTKYKANKTHLDDANQNIYIQLHNQIDTLYNLEDMLLNIDNYLQSAHKRLKARSKGEQALEEKQTRAHKHHDPLM
jgi:hypothetical protein